MQAALNLCLGYRNVEVTFTSVVAQNEPGAVPLVLGLSSPLAFGLICVPHSDGITKIDKNGACYSILFAD